MWVLLFKFKEDYSMAGKNLAYFMREDLKKDEIVEVEGPATIKDENGNPVVFKIKKLRMDRINEIFDSYKRTEVFMDRKRKQPYVSGGKAVMIENTDTNKAFRHLMTEAIVYPDMHDSELMEFFDCVDVTDMPLRMFSTEEYAEVSKLVNKVLGLDRDDDADETEDDIREAKN